MKKLFGNKNSGKEMETVKHESKKSIDVSSSVVKSRSALSTTSMTTTEQRVITTFKSESNFSRETTCAISSSNNLLSSGLNNNFVRDFTRHSYNGQAIHRDANPFQTYREVKNYSTEPRSVFSRQPFSNSRLQNASTSTNPNIPTASSTPHSNSSVSSIPKRRIEENNNVNILAKKIEKLDVKVKGSTQWYDELNSKVPCYRTRSKKIVLLINIKTFINDKTKERKGSEIDAKNLHSLFSQMGFKVETPKRNEWTKKDVENAISSFKSKNLKKYAICIVVVMSHGSGGIRSDSTVIVCSNKETIETNWIVTQFDGYNCKDLLGKPKIFIFQCCRGDQEYIYRVPKTDGIDSAGRAVSPQADILIAYATVPGYVSYRYEDIGSWYIYTFCKISMEHACDTHVEDLLKIVDEEMKTFSDNHNELTKPTTTYESRGFKRCYLHPKMS